MPSPEETQIALESIMTLSAMSASEASWLQQVAHNPASITGPELVTRLPLVAALLETQSELIRNFALKAAETNEQLEEMLEQFKK